jgi:hypothetical protein
LARTASLPQSRRSWIAAGQAQSDAECVRALAIEKWDGKLPEAVYASAPIPFLNVGKQ